MGRLFALASVGGLQFSVAGLQRGDDMLGSRCPKRRGRTAEGAKMAGLASAATPRIMVDERSAVTLLLFKMSKLRCQS